MDRHRPELPWRSRRSLCAPAHTLALALLLQAGSGTIAEAEEGELRSVLLLEPRPADKGSKIPTGMANLLERTISTYLQRLGSYSVRKLTSGQGAGCAATDYACYARGAGLTGGYVVGVQVQINPDNTLYFTVTVADSQNSDHAESKGEGFGTPGRERKLNKTEEDALAERIEATVGELLKRLQGNSSAPQPSMIAAPPARKGPTSVTLTVEVSGRGSVNTEPPSLACPTPTTCTQVAESGSTLTLLAAPRLPAAVATWSGVPCINSTLNDPLRCQVNLAQDSTLKLTFDRSTARKAVTGVLWSLAIVGIGIGAAYLGANGSECSEPGTICRRYTWREGIGTLSAGVGFGIAGALTYWLPR